MKIALAQINPTIGDFSGNLNKILDFTRRAVDAGADLTVFPELAVCGYLPADFLEKEAFVARAGEVLAQIAEQTAYTSVLIGAVLPSGVLTGKHVRNVAVLLTEGRVSFVQQKMLLPFYDIFDEQRYFEPAQQQTIVTLKGQPLAITICEDAWNDKMYWPRRFYPVDPVEELMTKWPSESDTPRIILNISASPYWKDKRQVRSEMLAALARRHKAVVAMCNQVGGNDSILFDGTSIAFDPDGCVIAKAKSFEEDLVVFDTSDRSNPCIEVAEDDEIAGIWNALVMGTRDYVRKCGFSKVLIGLSGGIDSALVAAIAVEAFGPENVIGVGMPSEFSSSHSVDDARALAENLGIRFELLAIREIYDQFTGVLHPLFAGTPFGLAEENIQPRIRGTLLMALSNKFGALVLTTGNKSEMAVGYCTLYGDMVGGLAVIGDVAKTRVYQLSRYANREREVIPLSTIEKPPSAELRPGQLDTDSLPPYDVLDPILEAYVERYESAAQIAREHGVDLSLVEQVLRLVERSEYKRQQAAPVLKVTRKSFGNGRRFPIAVKVQV